MGFYDYLATLPKALDKEEQQNLVKEFYETRDEKIRDKIISHNLRLVAACVLRTIGRVSDIDDYMQMGTIELMNVLDNKYDITKGVAFSTFAYLCITGKLHSKVKAKINSADVLNLPESKLINYPTNNNYYENFDENEFVDEILMKDLLADFVEELDEQDRYIFEHTYGFNGKEVLDAKVLAENLDKCVSLVYVRLRELKKELKHYLKCHGRTPEKLQKDAFMEYYANTDNHMHKDILDYYYGLNDKEKTTPRNIPNVSNYSQNNVYRSLNEVLLESAGVSGDSDITREDYINYLTTCNDFEEIEILGYYAGLNGEEPINEYGVADELKIRKSRVVLVIKHINEKILNMKAKEKITRTVQFITLSDIQEYYMKANDNTKALMEVVYGLNGKEKMDIDAIGELLGLDSKTVLRKKNLLENEIKLSLLYKDREK